MKKTDSTAKTTSYNNAYSLLSDEHSWNKAKGIEAEIREIVQSILAGEEITIVIQRTQNLAHGDFTTTAPFQLAKIYGKSPQEIAGELVKRLEQSNELMSKVEEIKVVGGYINFFVKKDRIIQHLERDIRSSDSLSAILKNKKIMFEYGHPNPFKMIHVGHLRNFILGESLTKVFEKVGAEVIRVNYQGDVGMHVAKSIWGIRSLLKREAIILSQVEKRAIEERVAFIGKAYTLGAGAYEDDETAKEEIKQINYAVYSYIQRELIRKYEWNPAIKYEDFMATNLNVEEISEIWEAGKKWSLDAFRKFYKRIGTNFDMEYMESETLYFSDLAVKSGLEKGILRESQGAIIFDGKEYGLDVRVFVNSMGLPTYEGKELGLAEMEFGDFGEIDLCIHNVAVEQISFFKVTFKVEELLNTGKYKGKQFHNAYEFVGLKSGKMSSRKGSVVLATDIIDEAKELLRPYLDDRGFSSEEVETTLEKVALAAVKYSFLNIGPGKYLSFDLQTSVSFEGNSGPYLLYTFARANRIVNNFKEGLPGDSLAGEREEQEMQLMRRLLLFDSTIIEVAKSLSPNLLCSYLYELAQEFNSFYKSSPILNEKNTSKRLARIMLTKKVAEVMKNGLGLLGIETVERM